MWLQGKGKVEGGTGRRWVSGTGLCRACWDLLHCVMDSAVKCNDHIGILGICFWLLAGHTEETAERGGCPGRERTRGQAMRSPGGAP